MGIEQCCPHECGARQISTKVGGWSIAECSFGQNCDGYSLIDDARRVGIKEKLGPFGGLVCLLLIFRQFAPVGIVAESRRNTLGGF